MRTAVLSLALAASLPLASGGTSAAGDKARPCMGRCHGIKKRVIRILS